MNPNLIFRIAVREIESWVLADRKAFALFLGIQHRLIPSRPDEIDNPKMKVIELANCSRKRYLREAIVPNEKGTARLGPDYNGQMTYFVKNFWNIHEAMKNSNSLKRTYDAINHIKF